jgi:hypothetical protein
MLFVGITRRTNPVSLFQLAILRASAIVLPMLGDVTQLLSAIESGDLSAADQLLPLVYQELRQLAAHKMADEKPGQKLQSDGDVRG